MSVKSRHLAASYVTDCPECGAEAPRDIQYDTNSAPHYRWARQHALENPGHRVHVEMSRILVYEADR